eukprot:g31934.t1
MSNMYVLVGALLIFLFLCSFCGYVLYRYRREGGWTARSRAAVVPVRNVSSATSPDRRRRCSLEDDNDSSWKGPPTPEEQPLHCVQEHNALTCVTCLSLFTSGRFLALKTSDKDENHNQNHAHLHLPALSSSSSPLQEVALRSGALSSYLRVSEEGLLCGPEDDSYPTRMFENTSRPGPGQDVHVREAESSISLSLALGKPKGEREQLSPRRQMLANEPVAIDACKLNRTPVNGLLPHLPSLFGSVSSSPDGSSSRKDRRRRAPSASSVEDANDVNNMPAALELVNEEMSENCIALSRALPSVLATPSSLSSVVGVLYTYKPTDRDANKTKQNVPF